MKESSTYQAILDEGRAEGRAQEARAILFRQGRVRFNAAPPAAVRSALEAVNDVERLEALSERLLYVTSWDDLLAAPK